MYYFLGSLLVFAFAFYKLKHNQNKCVFLLGRFIGYFNIYKKKLFRFLKTKSIDYEITDITINNGTKYLNEISNNTFDVLQDNEDIYRTIEVFYKNNNRNYIILYTKNNKLSDLTFPIYNSKEVTGGAFSITDESIILVEIAKSQIIFDEKTQERISDIIRSLSGPKGNFYEDCGYLLKPNKHFIIDFINKKLNINCEQNIDINILYSNGEMLVI